MNSIHQESVLYLAIRNRSGKEASSLRLLKNKLYCTISALSVRLTTEGSILKRNLNMSENSVLL